MPSEEERERAIRLLKDALAEIDAGLNMSAKAGVMNAIEYLNACGGARHEEKVKPNE